MGRRPFRALQVEVTSRCTSSCAICLRTELADRWRSGDLSLETWQALRPDLRTFEHVHLQGWGEPLLHDGLRDMARDAHRAGCRVGITTNGDLLDEAADWLVRERVEVLTLSLAGVGTWNRRLRGGADPSDLFGALERLAGLRGRQRRPRLQMAFVLARGNAAELPELIRVAAECGVDSIVVNHLDVIPTARIAELSLCGDRPVPPAVRESVDCAIRLARSWRVKLRPPSLGPRPMVVCDLDPTAVVSVRWDGHVGPCVQLNMPLDGPVPRWTVRGAADIAAPSFGRVGDQPLSSILSGTARGRFVGPLVSRREVDRRFRRAAVERTGWGVVALRELDAAERGLEDGLAIHPFPAACRGCAKASGW